MTALLYQSAHTVKRVLSIAMSRNIKDSVYLLKAFEPQRIGEREGGRFKVPKACRWRCFIYILLCATAPAPRARVHLVEAANKAYQFPRGDVLPGLAKVLLSYFIERLDPFGEQMHGGIGAPILKHYCEVGVSIFMRVCMLPWP